MEENRISDSDTIEDVAGETITESFEIQLDLERSENFVGMWNQLVSTTNWEKGRIIHQWRESLMNEGVPATAYSDEAWCRMVGGVTSQHVGRLRRVFQRFGESFTQYSGLYWSHFHAALDWDDAEMWLEGCVQNRWSVSKMRKKRWETLGAIEEDKPDEQDVVTNELDEDFESANNDAPNNSLSKDSDYDESTAGPRAEGPDFGDEDSSASAGREDDDGAMIYAEDEQGQPIQFVRPFANLPELPDDLSEAFEAFKLAIIRQKTTEWAELSMDDLLAALDALKELASAPSAEASPF